MKTAITMIALALASAALGACTAGGAGLPEAMSVTPTPRPEGKKTALNTMITRYAAAYDVPETLVHHVVKRESNYDPEAYNSGNWGLMQIRYPTAKGMGYRGKPKGLLNAETNLKYAVKYLRGAYVTARGDQKEADWLYRTGYYYAAKRRGLLEEAGLTRAGTASDMAVATLDDAEDDPRTAAAVDKPAEAQPQMPDRGRMAADETVSETSPALPGVNAQVAEADEGAQGTAVPSMAFAGTTPTSGPANAPIPSFRPTR